MQEHKQNEMQTQNRNKSIQEQFGFDPTGMTDKQIEIGMQLAGQKENKQNQYENLRGEDDQRYNTVKDIFGEKAANLYKAAPEGGKTQLLKGMLETAQRGGNFDEFLNSQMPDQQNKEIGEETGIKTIDFDKGLTPKERAQRQNQRYSTNLPLYEESQKKSIGLEAEKEHLEILEELSPQIKAIERFNMNPQTGELFFPGLASPEAQRFVKTINDFTVQAKDSYGSRVTNFDLNQFMKRLPTLANSEEGRRQIINQMKIINEINAEREKSLQKVIDEHGGIRNIDYDQAQRMADKLSSKRISELKKQFSKVGLANDKLYDKQIQQEKAIVPKNHIGVKRADGSTGYIPQGKIKEFLKIEGNELL